MKTQKKIAVIGAGLGGLSSAIHLANSGLQVDLYEQNSGPGGKANVIDEDGYRFDTGPSLLTMPFVLEELFNESGENINEYLTIEQLDVICKYFFADGSEILAYSDLENFANQIAAVTQDSADSLKDYLNHCKKIYDLTSDLFLFNSPLEISNYLRLRALKTLFRLNEIDSFRTMHQANSSFFKDKKTIQLFDRYATYNGSNPYMAPATLNIIQHVEYNLGGYIVKEGIYRIPLALKKLAEKKGVNFHFNSKVEKIIVEEKRVKGIKVNNQSIDYDDVVSNVDVNFTYSKLLENNNSRLSKRYQKLEPSLSGLVFYWGVEGIHNELEVHNIIFSEDYEKEFEDIFTQKIIPIDPTIYIYISSKFSKTDAPDGFENWFVMINTPHIENQNWENEIKIAREKIINKISEKLNINLRKKIVFEKMLSPVEIEKNTNSFKGSIYGISSNSKTAAFLRHPNESKEFKGLYFCGGSAHPGGGIPLVLLSGKLAGKSILKKL